MLSFDRSPSRNKKCPLHASVSSRHVAESVLTLVHDIYVSRAGAFKTKTLRSALEGLWLGGHFASVAAAAADTVVDIAEYYRTSSQDR